MSSKTAAPASLLDWSLLRPALLESLRGRQHQLAVATGKSRRGLDEALDSANLRRWFDATRTADETRSKPHPQMLDDITANPGLVRIEPRQQRRARWAAARCRRRPRRPPRGWRWRSRRASSARRWRRPRSSRRTGCSENELGAATDA